MRKDLLIFLSIAFGVLLFLSFDIFGSLVFGDIGFFMGAFGKTGFYLFLIITAFLILFLTMLLKAENRKKYKKIYQLGAMKKPIKLLRLFSTVTLSFYLFLLLLLLSFKASKEELSSIDTKANLNKWDFINIYIQQKKTEKSIKRLKNQTPVIWL